MSGHGQHRLKHKCWARWLDNEGTVHECNRKEKHTGKHKCKCGDER